MKIFTLIMKILAALAAVAGVVYIIATYGDKIVAWAKGLLGKCPCCDCDCECDDCDCECDCDCDDACECECEDETIEEVAVEETVEATEADFEG